MNAAGLVVMPGGIDMHCRIAGPKVNAARKLRPEERRGAKNVVSRTALTHSGTLGSVPSTFVTGYKYIGLGYTTAFDAAVPPLMARHAHEEFADMPCLDKGFYVLAGNNHFVMRAIQQRQPEQLKGFVAWLLGAAKAYAIKLVNPGGVEVWKHRAGGNVHSVDEPVDHFGVTARQIVHDLAAAADALQLPHAVHVHCNNLGLPGNWQTTLETMKALEGHRGHMTHVQFHSDHLHAARRQGTDVPTAAVRDQVRPAAGRGRRLARDARRQDAVRRPRLRRGPGTADRRLVRGHDSSLTDR